MYGDDGDVMFYLWVSSTTYPVVSSLHVRVKLSSAFVKGTLEKACPAPWYAGCKSSCC